MNINQINEDMGCWYPTLVMFVGLCNDDYWAYKDNQIHGDPELDAYFSDKLAKSTNNLYDYLMEDFN